MTTLVFGFAGSWVFLYPLPFHAAGQWGDWATALFSASVLLVGLSIIVWCVAILAWSPARASARDRSALNRLGAAMGFGDPLAEALRDRPARALSRDPARR